MNTRGTTIAVVCIALGGLNFVLFLLITMYLGGGALNGYARDGRYYVASQGRITEVSAGQWRLNRLHALSLVLTHPLGMFGLSLLNFHRRFARTVYQVPMATIAAREERIRNAGPLLATRRSSGEIGPMSLPGPWLRTTIFPAGVVIAPLFHRPFAIAAADIMRVRFRRGWLHQGIELIHRSPQVPSPILLRCGENAPLLVALRAIAPVIIPTKPPGAPKVRVVR